MPSRPSLRRLTAAVAIAAATDACLSGEEVNLGHNVDAAGAGLPGNSIDAALGPDGGTGLISAAISATTGTICKGACVDLVATATGGGSPYTYTWGAPLGEGPGPKSVCPVATTTYSVVVSSTVSEQQSTASAMVTVVPCEAGTLTPDAGPAPPPSDAGPGQTSAAMCVSNPSLEGPTMIGTSGVPGVPPTAAPPQWQVCLGAPDVDPSRSLQLASDGKSYVGLAAGTGTFSSMNGSVGTTLCAALQPGVHYSFCLDLGIGVRGLTPVVPPPGAPAPTLELWGGTAPCSEDQLLWTSPPITNTDSWVKACGSFVPSRALTDIVLIPALAGTAVAPGNWSYVIVDHIVAGP